MPDVAYKVVQSNEKTDPGIDIDIDMDVYGATIFSVIYDLSELFGGEDQDNLGVGLHLLRLSFVLLLLASNFSLQVGMCYYIYTYVVLTNVHSAEDVYQKYHNECFVDGQFNATRWKHWEWKAELCGIGFANFGFMFAVLSLWWLTMLNEFRKNERLITTLSTVQSTTKAAEMVHLGDDGVVRFKKISYEIRYGLYSILVVPKLCIAVGLLLIGTTWLTSTLNYAELILNAIALEFVIQVDEMLFSAMLPSFICARIANTKFWKPSEELSQMQRKDHFQVHYTLSYIYLFGVALLVYLFLSYGQSLPYIGVFPGFENDLACHEYLHAITRRVCKYGFECFPRA